MNKFTFTGKYLKLVALGLGLSFQLSSVNAALVNNNFDDLGTSTVDLVNSIEWLDVSSTRGLEWYDVQADLRSSGGFFDPADGWRYATGADFSGLVDQWFGVDYSKGGRLNFGENDSTLVDLFIGTFGDTVDQHYDETNNKINARAGEFLSTQGVLADNSDRAGVYRKVAVIADFDYVDRTTGLPLADQFDYISDRSSLAFNRSFGEIGHFIIRDYVAAPAVSVAEPSSLALLSLGLIGLMRRRRNS